MDINIKCSRLTINPQKIPDPRIHFFYYLSGGGDMGSPPLFLKLTPVSTLPQFSEIRPEK